MINIPELTSLAVVDLFRLADLRFQIINRFKLTKFNNKDEFFLLKFWTDYARRLIDDSIIAVTNYQIAAIISRDFRNIDFYKYFVAKESVRLEHGLSLYLKGTASCTVPVKLSIYIDETEDLDC